MTEFTRDEWGPWVLDLETLLLFPRGPEYYRYEIPLERCRTSAAILDWIIQLSHKTWGGTPEALAGLVKAFDYTLNLQKYFCPGEQSRTVPYSEMRALIESNIRHWEYIESLLDDDVIDFP